MSCELCNYLWNKMEMFPILWGSPMHLIKNLIYSSASQIMTDVSRSLPPSSGPDYLYS